MDYTEIFLSPENIIILEECEIYSKKKQQSNIAFAKSKTDQNSAKSFRMTS